MPQGGTPSDENALDSPFLKGAKAFRPEGDVPVVIWPTAPERTSPGRL